MISGFSYKWFLCILALLALPDVNLCAQDKAEEQKRLANGKGLYRSEIASWHSTDLVRSEPDVERLNIGGYFSYEGPDSLLKTVFFSKGDSSGVVATVYFDKSLSPSGALVDKTTRAFTPHEAELFAIRNEAASLIGSDKFFKHHEDAHFNLIPVVTPATRRVYVITASTKPNEVIFGNDYVLTFDEGFKLVDKKRIHQSLLRLPAKNLSGDPKKKIASTYHTHLEKAGSLLSSTDICTLMLYGHLTEWTTHMVICGDDVSVWNVSANMPESGRDRK